MLTAWAISVAVPFFRDLTSTTHSRLLALDGFRGFLGVSVFVHHCAIYFRFLRTGLWVVPPSSLYAFFGSGAVAYFFMMTGFLFWNKALRDPGSLTYLKLLPGRVRRLIPMYLASYGVVVVLIAIASHFKFAEPPARVELCSKVVF
jgi:peptidoglycan/LPS O-acetylase OafA/YrhL